MEPSSSNQPNQTPAQTPEVAPSGVSGSPAPIPTPTQPVVPEQPPQAPATPEMPEPEAAKPGGSKVLLIVALVILIIAILGVAAYFLGFVNLGSLGVSPTQAPSQTPRALATPVSIPVATASGSPLASTSGQTQGTVTGKLCYPSEVAPAGSIVAKDNSGQSFTQAFAGTQAGAALSYSFALAPGTYHLKYETSPTMAGYYTACAKNPTNDVCALDSNHVNLDVVVSAGKTVSDVDLCDFYWNQTQKQSLESAF